MSLAKRATGRWEEIFRATAGTELSDAMAAGHNKHVACPQHDGGKSFRLFNDWQDTGGGICNTCGRFASGISLLMWLLVEDFKSVAKRVEDVIGKDADWKPGKKDLEAEANLLRLQRIQEIAKPVGDTVTAYLNARGVAVPPGLRQGHMAYWDGETKVGEFDVMLGKFVSPSGKPVTWHITYLDGDRKAKVESPRKMMPQVGDEEGGAVRLFPHGEVLGIAEGIETAAAAAALFKVPVWSALNADNLAKFRPPNGLKKLLIFGDNDASCTGQAVAYTLARRLYKRIPIREVHIPPMLGMDWADVLKEKIELGEFKP